MPVTAFLNAEQLAKDVAKVNDAARGKFLSVVGMALALMRNYDSFKAPTHFRIADLMKKFDKTFGATGTNYGKVGGDRTMSDIEQRRADRWNFLFIAGMWFQDLFNYDFRRTEMCIIPYATQQGEISFCAYNTGIGWRNIIEKMHMTATLTKWYEEHGRHEIFAGNKNVPLTDQPSTLILNAEAVAAGAQTDLDDLHIAKNAREEKLAARKQAQMTPEELRAHKEMERLYRQQVLKEQPTLQIQGLAAAGRSRPSRKSRTRTSFRSFGTFGSLRGPPSGGPRCVPMTIYTIGFTRKSARTFFTLLKDAGARRLLDIRLNNLSQLAGYTKRDDLAFFCESLGIGYRHLLELAPTQPMLDASRQGGGWEHYERDFLELMRSRRVEELPRELFDGACLLCSEPTPVHCHRRLAAEYLRQHWGGVSIIHL